MKYKKHAFLIHKEWLNTELFSNIRCNGRQKWLMKKVNTILSIICVSFILIGTGCSNDGCPTATSAGKGEPPGGGGKASQKLFDKNVRNK